MTTTRNVLLFQFKQVHLKRVLEFDVLSSPAGLFIRQLNKEKSSKLAGKHSVSIILKSLGDSSMCC